MAIKVLKDFEKCKFEDKLTNKLGGKCFKANVLKLQAIALLLSDQNFAKAEQLLGAALDIFANPVVGIPHGIATCSHAMAMIKWKLF